ncbi:helix-turn-helix domain-containing protein [Leptospira fletcheri]|nr:helix-turn-helix domain-containing protein [Leptospira fletcheri]
MLNFKQSSNMEPSVRDLIYGSISAEELRFLLPETFPYLLQVLKGEVGLLVLASDLEPGSLEEVASLGYGEEGFFYTFLSRGSEVRQSLESERSPFFLTKDQASGLYKSGSEGCLLSGIYLDEKLQGFLLIELSSPPEPWQTMLLALLCQNIARSFRSEKKEASAGFAPSREATEERWSCMGKLLFRMSGGGKSVLDNYRKLGMLKIRGPRSSGKKTLAKWLHRNESADRGFLVIGVLPEQAGKLEKSLEEWETMVQGGTLIFEKIQEYSALQQKLLYEYSIAERSRPRLVFLENSEISPKEELVFFRSFLESNFIELPIWSNWPKEDREEMVTLFFEEAKEAQGRRDLVLSKEARTHLVHPEMNRNLEDLRNLIEEGVLHTSGRELLGFSETISRPQGVSIPDADDLDLRKAVEALERQKILLAYKLFGGNQIRMSKALGISRGSLQYKLKNLGLG